MTKKILIAASILAVLAVVLMVTLFAFRKKSAPVSDDDLTLVRVNVSSNENAFYILEEAAKELFWPENATEINNIIEWEFWDARLAGEILSSNQKTLDLFDKAALRPHLRVPEIQSLGENFEYIKSWKKLSQLSMLRSQALFHEGKEKEALNSALQVAQLGHQMEDSDGAMIHYLVGSAVKNMAFHVTQQLIGGSSLSCDTMRPCADKLEQLYANKSALTNVIKMEYQLQCKLVDDWVSGKAIGLTNQNMPATGISKRLFDPEETRQIYAQFARTGLKSIPLPLSQMPTNSFGFSTNRLPMLSLLLSGNAIGRTLAEMSDPPSQKFKCRENVNAAATLTIFALKCYKQKYGSLPPSLEELVPEFLSKIPIDDFDGKPLRYSAEKKILYSVGPDLIDSNGKEKDMQNKTLDIQFKIQF